MAEYTEAQRDVYTKMRSLILHAIDIGDRFYRVGKYKSSTSVPLVESERVSISTNAAIEQKVSDDKLSTV